MGDRFTTEIHGRADEPTENDYFIVRDTLTNTVREVCKDLGDAVNIAATLNDEGIYNYGRRYAVAV